jgi:hypothetical protein
VKETDFGEDFLPSEPSSRQTLDEYNGRKQSLEVASHCQTPSKSHRNRIKQTDNCAGRDDRVLVEL